MVVVVAVLIDPTTILIVLVEEIRASNGEADGFPVLVKGFCELMEPRVG
jgi:hypothetical protein